MTDNNHPISVPPELVKQMAAKSGTHCFFPYQDLAEHCQSIADQAAQWGYEQRGADIEDKLQKARDEELEACCKWVAWELRRKGQSLQWSDDLRAARRPKPSSLKEQALTALERWAEDEHGPGAVFHKGLEVGLIRRALEALDD